MKAAASHRYRETLSLFIHSVTLWQTILAGCNCPGVNPCLNGGLCAPDCGPEGYICLCSPGFTGKICQTATSSTNCSVGEYQCNDNSCIPASLRCDYFADCPGRDDEMGCACAGGDFVCDDGTCLQAVRLCDGFRDCPNSDDEGACTTAAPTGTPPAASDCSDPGPLPSGTQSGLFTDGATLQFTCNLGHTLVGSAATVCTAGLWSQPIPSCHQNCVPASSPANGVASGTSGHGDIVTFICNVGYSLAGNQFIVCQDGGWIGTAPTCYADCIMPASPANGNVAGSSFHGDGVVFSCDGGYTLVGNSTSTCSDGTWSDSPGTCHADCTDPGTPVNGQRFGTLTHGTAMNYVCNSEFTMVGDSMVTCSDGVWSNVPPLCFADCSDPGTPDDGSRTGGTHHGESSSYSCVANYYLYGASNLTCTNGIWSDVAPSCYDLRPTYHWELSGKCAASDPEPADCLGNVCASPASPAPTVYEVMQGRGGEIFIFLPTLADIPLTPAPVPKLAVHTCATHYDTGNIISFPDFDGECLADAALCGEGATVAVWMNIDMGQNPTIRYHLTSGGQTMNGRGFAIWTVDGATPLLVWAAQVPKNSTALYRRMFAIDGFPQNTWFHFVATFRAPSTGNMYVDGLPQTHIEETDTYPSTTFTDTILIIGGSNSAMMDTSKRGNAGMSDLQVFYRELSWEEVGALYEQETAS